MQRKSFLKDRVFVNIICMEIAVLVILSAILIFKSIGKGVQEDAAGEQVSSSSYIKWVDFSITKEALSKAYKYDVETHGKEIELHWIELLAYLGTRYGGDFKRYKASDMEKLANALLSGEETMGTLTEDLMKYYPYYYEAYHAVLGGLVGEFERQIDENTYETVYGLKAYSPIARDFYYSDSDDFGVSRSYGYKRKHLGHDMMGSIGSPIIAVESGYVEALGWNQYGGWRIGIRSFDGKRYYYYAHLKKDTPYNKSLEVGSIVTAGDVIGYLGRTGYSSKENVNNITTPHLHFGLQLIFDDSQKDGWNQIWISCYELTKFLYQNRSLVQRNTETKEYNRVYDIKDPAEEYYIENNIN